MLYTSSPLQISKYISELLFRYDCVIIPGFGGFVANYSPASIHPTQHIFTPPSKNIVFNKSLVNNDGLLANHIATAENIPFSTALEKINVFVEDCRIKLSSAKTVVLENIGTLYLDVEKNIRFEPSNAINYLIESYGLTAFQSAAIKRGTTGFEKTFRDREPIPLKNKKLNIKKYVALALTAPLVLVMLWIPLKTDLLDNVNYNSLNPFDKINRVYKPRTQAAPSFTFEKIDETKLNKVDSKNISEAIFAVADTINRVVKKETQIQPVTELLPYHIVGGCFEIQANAEKLVNDMKSQNLEALIIGQNKNGLYIVSLGNYASKKEAFEELASIRKINSGAWLMKN